MTCGNPFSLACKTILVTGASSGIGRQVAVECSRLGAQVVLVARNECRLQETLSLLEGEGHRYVCADLTDDDDVRGVVDFCNDGIDGLVYSAGVSMLKPLQVIKETELKHVFSTNTFAPMMLVRNMAKGRLFRKGASIVLISSISGNGNVAVGLSAYGSSKSALNSFMQYAALELSSRDIRVNAVLPGRVETDLLKAVPVSGEDLERDLSRYPLHRYGKPSDVAYACVYLLSDVSGWVTGTSLVVDGGRHLT